jgi:hypothetical protein
MYLKKYIYYTNQIVPIIIWYDTDSAIYLEI